MAFNFVDERNLRTNIKDGNVLYLPHFELIDGVYQMDHSVKVETLKDLRDYKQEYASIYDELRSLFAQKISTVYKNAISKLIYIEDKDGKRSMNGSKTATGEKSGTFYDYVAENSVQSKYDSVSLILNGLDSRLNKNLENIRFKPFNVKDLFYGSQIETEGLFKNPVVLPEFTDNGIAINYRNGRNSNSIEVKYRTYSASEAEKIYKELFSQLENVPEELRDKMQKRLNELFDYASETYSSLETGFPAAMIESRFNVNCRKVMALSTMLFNPDLPVKKESKIIEPDINNDNEISEFDKSIIEESMNNVQNVPTNTPVIHSVDFYGLICTEQDIDENGKIVNSIKPKAGKVFVLNSDQDGQLRFEIKDNVLIDQNSK